MQPIETITDGNFKLEIFQDEYINRPDKDMDCAGELLQTRYRIDSDGPRELIRAHGNIVFEHIESDRCFHSYWVIDRKTWEKEWGKGKAGKDKAKAYADGMRKTFLQWMNGEIYGYVVSVRTDGPCDCDEWETKESVWGYYGMEDVMKEGKSVLDACIKEEKEVIDFEHNGMAL